MNIVALLGGEGRFGDEIARVVSLQKHLPTRPGIRSNVEVDYIGGDDDLPWRDKLKAPDDDFAVCLIITIDRGRDYPPARRLAQAAVYFEIDELRSTDPVYEDKFALQIAIAIEDLDELFAEADQP